MHPIHDTVSNIGKAVAKSLRGKPAMTDEQAFEDAWAKGHDPAIVEAIRDRLGNNAAETFKVGHLKTWLRARNTLRDEQAQAPPGRGGTV